MGRGGLFIFSAVFWVSHANDTFHHICTLTSISLKFTSRIRDLPKFCKTSTPPPPAVCMHIYKQTTDKHSVRKGTGRFGNFFMPKRPVLSWFCFWFSTNWLGPPLSQYQFVFYNTVCRILELKKNDKTINVYIH